MRSASPAASRSSGLRMSPVEKFDAALLEAGQVQFRAPALEVVQGRDGRVRQVPLEGQPQVGAHESGPAGDEDALEHGQSSCRAVWPGWRGGCPCRRVRCLRWRMVYPSSRSMRVLIWVSAWAQKMPSRSGRAGFAQGHGAEGEGHGVVTALEKFDGVPLVFLQARLRPVFLAAVPDAAHAQFVGRAVADAREVPHVAQAVAQFEVPAAAVHRAVESHGEGVVHDPGAGPGMGRRVRVDRLVPRQVSGPVGPLVALEERGVEPFGQGVEFLLGVVRLGVDHDGRAGGLFPGQGLLVFCAGGRGVQG